MSFQVYGDTIYVPAVGSFLYAALPAGTAIVGTPQGDGRILIDYEGDIYGRGWTFEERVFHAHARHVERYPTVARQLVPSDAVVEVADYFGDPPQVLVHPGEGQLLLDVWLADDLAESA